MALFVVQEHQARSHHFDFRLEINGVLKSWAVPKGPSMNPKDKHLAIQVEDHSLKHARYEGIIPDGQYGAGPVVIWDKGTFKISDDQSQAFNQWKKGHISFSLHGKKLRGEFSLIKMKGRDRQWLLTKHNDDYADPKWKLKSELTKIKIKSLKVKEPHCSSG